MIATAVPQNIPGSSVSASPVRTSRGTSSRSVTSAKAGPDFSQAFCLSASARLRVSNRRLLWDAACDGLLLGHVHFSHPPLFFRGSPCSGGLAEGRGRGGRGTRKSSDVEALSLRVAWRPRRAWRRSLVSKADEARAGRWAFILDPCHSLPSGQSPSDMRERLQATYAAAGLLHFQLGGHRATTCHSQRMPAVHLLADEEKVRCSQLR